MKSSSLACVLTIAISFIVFASISFPAAVDNAAASTNVVFNTPVVPARAAQAIGPSIVSISGRQMIVQRRRFDGVLLAPALYTIRGVDWSPAGTGTTSALESRRQAMEDWAAVDIPLIKAMNVNTVFMYLDPHLTAAGMAVLNQLYFNNDIMVVMTVDEGTNNVGEIQQAVNFFRNHPGILAWNVGVEWNINLYFGHATSLQDAAARTESAATLIKSLDNNHPVLTSYGDIDIGSVPLSTTQGFVNDTCRSVDAWALNIFRNSDFGTLFDQWKAITNKPMLLGEFGTDALLSYNQNHPPSTGAGEPMQALWDLAEWNHLAKNLSANHPGRVAIGGFIFEWNDEWWKVAPAGQHDADGGDGNLCGGHPDNFCNEEYFGIAALDPTNVTRQTRAVYNTMTMGFAPGYVPPQNQELILRASSAGFGVPNTNQGFGRFYIGNSLRFDHQSVQGRGFNVGVVDPCTGALTAQTFDTWEPSTKQTVMTALNNFLTGLPNGVIVLLAVGDESGLTPASIGNCTHLSDPWVTGLEQTLHTLGSTQIDAYCYRDSWAMAVIKGNPSSKSESLKTNQEASAQITLQLASSLSPASRSFSGSPGKGTISVNVPNGCNWTAVSNDSFITIDSGSSGSSSGIVTYSIAANAGAVRSGTMTIAGNLFTVTQTPLGGSGGRTPFEFDSDAKTDNSVWRPSTGVWLIRNSSNGGSSSTGWGTNGDQIVPGDYDGDGKTDLAVWRPSTGVWFILNSSNGSATSTGWGVSTDIPAPGDYDGDGKTDIAVWRPSSGTWFILNSSNGSTSVKVWGVNGDVPASGDYDGDGKSDITVFRPSSGVWFIVKSSNNQTQTAGWGISGDKVVPADYDGDGKTDVAVWRPSTGVWFVLRSSDGSTSITGWGMSTDVAVPGDYDGDGKSDIAVWRPSSGTWFIINSSNGSTSSVVWGSNGDVPVPSAYVRP